MAQDTRLSFLKTFQWLFVAITAGFVFCFGAVSNIPALLKLFKEKFGMDFPEPSVQDLLVLYGVYTLALIALFIGGHYIKNKIIASPRYRMSVRPKDKSYSPTIYEVEIENKHSENPDPTRLELTGVFDAQGKRLRDWEPKTIKENMRIHKGPPEAVTVAYGEAALTHTLFPVFAFEEITREGKQIPEAADHITLELSGDGAKLVQKLKIRASDYGTPGYKPV